MSSLVRRGVVRLQSYKAAQPVMPPCASQAANMQHAMSMEAKRRRDLEDVTNSRFYVVKEPRRERNGRVIGIDLGTTNSCLSYLDKHTHHPHIIPSPTGSWVFPTAVTFDKNHTLRLFGEEARACVRTSASATLCSGKRLIGRRLGELGRVQSDMSKTNLLTLNERGEIAVEIMNRSYSVVHIMAMFLRYLKGEAERYLGERVDLAVVSVPAYFTPQQKVATEDAALSAGFDVLEIIDEPSAACLAYTVLCQCATPKSTANRCAENASSATSSSSGSGSRNSGIHSTGSECTGDNNAARCTAPAPSRTTAVEPAACHTRPGHTVYRETSGMSVSVAHSTPTTPFVVSSPFAPIHRIWQRLYSHRGPVGKSHSTSSSSISSSATELRHTAQRTDPVTRKQSLKRFLIFDLGGGTLDCAIMEHDTRRNRFTLVATHGDPMLGGNDWDTTLAQHFAEQFVAKWRVPLEEAEGNVGQGVGSYRNLLLEAEKAKIHFTHSSETFYGYNKAFHFSEVVRDIVPLEAVLTQEQYVHLTQPLRVRCLECVNTLLNRAGVSVDAVHYILLVGAMTRDPPVRHMLEEYLGKPVAPEAHCPADYAVAMGAAVRGGMLMGEWKELSARTRFVSGSAQSMRCSGNRPGMLRVYSSRVWRSLTGWLAPSSMSRVRGGVRWRGVAKGLSDEEIAAYAKELVSFESACARRVLLDRAENEANHVMRRVAADSNRRQGMQEKRVVQLSDQLKFWQYMVHNFHDHEEELQRTVRELQRALDELDGLVEDSKTGFTPEGRIDFAATREKDRTNTGEAAARRTDNHTSSSNKESQPAHSASQNTSVPNTLAPETADRAHDGHHTATAASSHACAGSNPAHQSHTSIRDADTAHAPRNFSATSSSLTGMGENGNSDNTSDSEPCAAVHGPRVIRRTPVLLPTQSADAAELVAAGHPALRNTDVAIPDSVRMSFLEGQVAERAWHEPPVPPGECGSWKEMQRALDAGEVPGGAVVLSAEELQSPQSLSDMLQTVIRLAPLDDTLPAEHVAMTEQAQRLQTMIVTEGEVAMESIELLMHQADIKERDLAAPMQSAAAAPATAVDG